MSESIDTICFNDDFARGYTRDPGSRPFLYERDQPRAIHEGDPEYEAAAKRSGLFTARGCGGFQNAMMRFERLVKFPEYSR